MLNRFPGKTPPELRRGHKERLEPIRRDPLEPRAGEPILNPRDPLVKQLAATRDLEFQEVAADAAKGAREDQPNKRTTGWKRQTPEEARASRELAEKLGFERGYNIRTELNVNLNVPSDIFDKMSDAEINQRLLELAERYRVEVSYMVFRSASGVRRVVRLGGITEKEKTKSTRTSHFQVKK